MSGLSRSSGSPTSDALAGPFAAAVSEATGETDSRVRWRSRLVEKSMARSSTKAAPAGGEFPATRARWTARQEPACNRDAVSDESGGYRAGQKAKPLSPAPEEEQSECPWSSFNLHVAFLDRRRDGAP
jgi:hypothetical protein